MDKITKLDVSLNGLLPVFVRFIEEWHPPKLSSETAYRDHLVDTLRRAVPEDARVEREFRHRGTTMDIYVAWKGILQKDDLAFELKKDLKKKTDFDRLVGQIEGLNPGENKVLVILIGETDDALFRRLKEKYISHLEGEGLDNATMAIVSVRPGERKRKKDSDDSGW